MFHSKTKYEVKIQNIELECISKCEIYLRSSSIIGDYTDLKVSSLEFSSSCELISAE